MVKNKAKILVTIPNLNLPGGVANYYNTLNLSNDERIDYFQINKEDNSFKLYHLILTYSKFFFIINNYDIVHVNPSLGSTSTWRDLIFIIISKLRNKKTIVFFRGWDEEYERKIKTSRVLSKLFKLYNKSNSFIVLGEFFKKKLIDLGISSQIKFFIETTIADDKHLNFFSIDDRCNSWSLNKKIRFLLISRIVENKGIILAIEIFSKIQKKYKHLNFEFIIAGDGPYIKTVKQYIYSMDLDNIILTGHIVDDKKSRILINSDIMLFPTKYGEGLPNCLLEGMLYGLPIISRINAAIPQWIINKKNGFLTSSINPDDFLDYISKLIEDQNLYKEISRTNHFKAKKLFVSKKIKVRLKKIYEQL